MICSILFLLQFWILFDLRFSLSLCTADWLIDLRFSCNLLSCAGWTFVFLWCVWLNSNYFEIDLFVILNVFWPVVFFAFFAFVYCWLINRSALFLQFVFLCMLDICFLMLYVVKFKLFCAWWLVCNCNFECFLTWFLFFAFFAFVCCWLIALLFHCLRAISVFVLPLLESCEGERRCRLSKRKCRFQNANAGFKTQMKISRGGRLSNTNAGFKTQMR